MDHEFNLNFDNNQAEQNYNKPLYGLHGQFTLTPDVTVPYFSTLMDLGRTTKELKTHEEVAPSLDNKYTLEELFQRQIDPGRVEHDIVDGYLNAHNKLKFFNSITVALFPKAKGGSIIPEFIEHENNDPRVPAEGTTSFDKNFGLPTCEKSIFGGVQYIKLGIAGLARLRWDSDVVDAVAVDGQHRLCALKQWIRQRNGELTDVERPTRISIVFLLLHSNAGFERNTGNNNNNIKGIAREIFTDLNKNAKDVDQATQIVLDDRNLESRCVRALITAGSCEDTPPLLPLSLLRWRDANNRFDQQYYLNSLVNLHLVVGDLLDLNEPKDKMNKTQVEKYIKSVEDCLSPNNNGRLEYNNKSLKEYYNSDYFDAGADDPDSPIRPFIGIPPNYLPIAVEGFKARYSSWILEVLNTFKPYDELLNYARDNDLICGTFSQYLSQPESARQSLQLVLENRHGDDWQREVLGRHIDQIQKIKCSASPEPGEQWAFKTIFQKAILRIAKKIEITLTDDEKLRIGTVKDFIAFVNKLYDKRLLRVHTKISDPHVEWLWACIAIHPATGRIMVNRRSEMAIENLLWVAYIGFRYASECTLQISADTGDGLITPSALFNSIKPKTVDPIWLSSEQCESIVTLIKDYGKNLAPTYKDRIESGEWTKETLEKEYKKVARTRTVELLKEFWMVDFAATQQETNANGIVQI